MRNVTISGRMSRTDRFILEAWLLARGISYKNNDRGGIDCKLNQDEINELRDGGHYVSVWH